MVTTPAFAFVAVALCLVGAALAGAGHLWARARGHVWLALALKTLPILLFLGMIWIPRDVSYPPAVRALVSAALLLSAAGDIFLALPRDAFIPGLASFLAAHIAYILAFYAIGSPWGHTVTWGWLALLALYGLAMLLLLWPHLKGALKIAVVAYMAAILAMLWQAGELAFYIQAYVLFAGALLFVISDSVLALDKFRGPVPDARGIVMVTYYAAQMLIALQIVLAWSMGA